MAESLAAKRSPSTTPADGTASPKRSSASRRDPFSTRPKSPEINDGTLRPTGKSAGRLKSPFGTAQSNRNSISEGKQDSAGIDPLSHVILTRTNVASQPKMRAPTQSDDESMDRSLASVTVSSMPSSRPSVDLPPPRSETLPIATKDKRNRASFFSRLVGPKRKESVAPKDDDDSDPDGTSEGKTTPSFSQQGYVPEFPLPPKYAKVKAHAKKEKEFGRLFLAQELEGRTGLEIAQDGGRKGAPTSSTSARKDGDAVWAMEFSKDGKHLAAGGKDYTVRVWAVLSNKEDRQADHMEQALKSGQETNPRLRAPVFKRRTVQEYAGHTASILDLSWSKNNFLLSSSMDKTVRLWHVSREECLCCFKHSDFVTSIQFHPRDDRFFIAGSLDSKLRLWSIPDKSVAYWNTLPDLITAVAFSPDGKTAVAGCLNGMCLFYETEGLKYQTQIHVRSAHGKNAKGSKITGIQAINYPPNDPNGEVKMLLTSNDSRVRVYNLRDKGLELKLKGNENSSSQIHATFSDDAKYIICGSEDRRAYIWSMTAPETEKDKRPLESFEANPAIVTVAVMAPTRTRQLLCASADPVYDLCNPPPVTLVSRAYSASSVAGTEDEHNPTLSVPPTPVTPDFSRSSKPEESPAYVARCAHYDGNIVVTADFLGNIKVYRQDCAHTNRTKNNESALTKRMMGRASSVATKTSHRSSRTSLQMTSHSSERILSWRQSLNSTNGSLDSFRQSHHPGGKARSVSPGKSLTQTQRQSSIATINTNGATPQSSPFQPPTQDHSKDGKSNASTAADRARTRPAVPHTDSHEDPLMLEGEQSHMFWNQAVYEAQNATAVHQQRQRERSMYPAGVGDDSTPASSTNSLQGRAGHLGVPITREITTVSRLSSEENSNASGASDGAENEAEHSADTPGHKEKDEGGEGEVSCPNCHGTSFKVRMRSVGNLEASRSGSSTQRQVLVCNACESVLP